MKLILLMPLTFIFLALSCVSSTVDSNSARLAQATKSEGEAFLAQGNYTAALAKLLEAKELAPGDPYVYNSLGLAYMGKKRDDLAEKAFQKAIKLKPDYSVAMNNLGAAYLRQKKWNVAIDIFHKVLDDLLYPTPHFPLSNLGWAYLGKKEYHKARTYFRKALDTLPWYVNASHGLARVYMETNRLDDALAYLNTCLERVPNSPVLYADLAEIYEIQGDTPSAKRAWKKVLRLSPASSALGRKAEKKFSGMN